MENVDEKEIQKTLDELKRRAEEFQAGKMYTPESSFSSFSDSNLKLILVIVGVVIVLVASFYFVLKSTGNKIDTKKNYKPAMFVSYFIFS